MSVQLRCYTTELLIIVRIPLLSNHYFLLMIFRTSNLSKLNSNNLISNFFFFNFDPQQLYAIVNSGMTLIVIRKKRNPALFLTSILRASFSNKIILLWHPLSYICYLILLLFMIVCIIQIACGTSATIGECIEYCDFNVIMPLFFC